MSVLSDRRPADDRAVRPARDRSAASEPAVDVGHLEHVLLGRWRDIRREARAFLTDPRLHRVEGLPVAEQR